MQSMLSRRRQLRAPSAPALVFAFCGNAMLGRGWALDRLSSIL